MREMSVFQIVAVILSMTVAFIWPVPAMAQMAHKTLSEPASLPPTPSDRKIYHTPNGFLVFTDRHMTTFENPLGEAMTVQDQDLHNPVLQAGDVLLHGQPRPYQLAYCFLLLVGNRNRGQITGPVVFN